VAPTNEIFIEIAGRTERRPLRAEPAWHLADAVRLLGSALPHILEPTGERPAAHAYDYAVSAAAEVALAIQALAGRPLDQVFADVEEQHRRSVVFDEQAGLNYSVAANTSDLSLALLALGEAIPLATESHDAATTSCEDALARVAAIARRLHVVSSS